MPPTLLLADDSVTIQRVIELTFADEDVKVVAVGDGEEAIAVLDRTPPDIVLADIEMPGRGGYEVAQHIKQTPHLAHIPVVLLTGAFEPIDQVRATAVGCDDVLAKPFEPQMLIGRVRELLSRPKKSASIDEPPSPVAATDHVRGGASSAYDRATSGIVYFEGLDQALASLTADSGFKDTPARSTAPGAGGNWLSSPAASAKSAHDAASPLESDEGRPTFGLSPAAPALPPLADAFAALLAAEQAGPAPPAAPSWPAPSAPAIGDEVIETIVCRVLDRLNDRVVRESVGDRVSSIAERLIREEIERIKSAAK